MAALILANVLIVTGLHLLQALIRRHQVNKAMDSQSVVLLSSIDQLQAAIDKRYLNPFSREPWLRLETGEGNDWYPLERLEVLIIENNQLINWCWPAPDRLRILTNIPTSSYQSHEWPLSLRFKFPNAEITGIGELIAIEGIVDISSLKE